MTVTYMNHLGESINLTEWPLMLQEPEKLLSYKWNYYAGTKSVRSFYAGLKELSCTISVFAESAEEYKRVMNHFLEVAEKDRAASAPGRLEIGGQYTECFIYGSELTEYEDDFYAVDKTLAIVSTDGLWHQDILYQFAHTGQLEAITGHGYPHAYPYGYSGGTGYYSGLESTHFSASDFTLTIYGYAHRPEVAVGGNVYKINSTVQVGERLQVDSAKKTVMLIKNNGVVVNMFSARDYRHYIFEQIPPGKNSVYWNGSFNFDLLLHTERGEPEWM